MGLFSSPSLPACAALESRQKPRSFIFSVLLAAAIAAAIAITIAASPTAQAAESEIQLPPVLLQMIRNKAVHDDLGLNAKQIDELRAVLQLLDGPWLRSRILPANEQQAKVASLELDLFMRLPDILSEDQFKRLKQLRRQALGTRMVLLEDVQAAAMLSDELVSKLAKRYAERDRVTSETQAELASKKISAEEAGERVAAAQAEEQNAVSELLTAEQRSRLSQLIGEPFAFNTVTRLYPSAPELLAVPSDWIKGAPVTLDDLRGKVVAVHFYAFQCINCQRNLPHYQAWHDDYADRGLVVIGIQTPETPSERDPNLVRKAAEREKIGYRILMDRESANWKAWANTMWPTVYLIDQDGLLVRWWQGEMNWQGSEGEKEMRQTIEALLARQEK
ncbi:Thiol-disulfide oxidoreductase YkuV [Novipirellula aureliae]|uniref:Thiol-disulfide oxidoreductase YkuV n=2 Tax=Novipirellula aureliae TaxID=2527966 RepID=A0A5C6DZ05_9BACT|nr:Thiol-disulfide oxidoreductase YkuV [Novipirellula aureliae]